MVSSKLKSAKWTLLTASFVSVLIVGLFAYLYERPVVFNPEFAQILDPYDPTSQDADFVARLQRDLCVPDSEIGTIGVHTKAQISIYKASVPGADRKSRLDARDIAELLRWGRCYPTGPQNYFEKVTFERDSVGISALSDLIVRLKKVLGTDQTLDPATTPLQGIRRSVATARRVPSISQRLSLSLPLDMNDQVTRDFFLALAQETPVEPAKETLKETPAPAAFEPNDVVGQWCGVVDGRNQQVNIEKAFDDVTTAFYDNMISVRRQDNAKFIRPDDKAYWSFFRRVAPDQLLGTITTPSGTASDIVYKRC